MNIQNTKPQFDASLYQINLGLHNDKKVIWIHFPYDKSLRRSLQENAKARWSSSQKAWYITDNRANRLLCNLELDIVGVDVLSRIEGANYAEFIKFQNFLTLKGYSSNTIRTYSIEFAQLLYLLKTFPVTNLTPSKLQSYFLYCFKELKLSENQIHSRMNAIKFYFEAVLHRDKMFFDIPRPKKPLLLPKSLNVDEVKRLFDVTPNIKHRLVLQLCYGMGLRVSEIVGLKIAHIDSHNMQVLIYRAKGKKDRYVNLPQTVLTDLRAYYMEYRPTEYLFEGQPSVPYSTRSVQMIFKTAMNKAGIRKQIGIHGLRHSYATHLLEYGTDISFIQKLLGHNDIKTTLLYTQVSDRNIKNIKSPLDKL